MIVPNDEARMTNSETMTKPEARKTARSIRVLVVPLFLRDSSFVIPSSFVIRASSFLLFRAQRFNRIHFRSATGGKQTGDQCYDTEEECNRSERERILGARVEEHRPHGARPGQRRSESDNQSEAHEFSTLHEDEAKDDKKDDKKKDEKKK